MSKFGEQGNHYSRRRGGVVECMQFQVVGKFRAQVPIHNLYLANLTELFDYLPRKANWRPGVFIHFRLEWEAKRLARLDPGSRDPSTVPEVLKRKHNTYSAKFRMMGSGLGLV